MKKVVLLLAIVLGGIGAYLYFNPAEILKLDNEITNMIPNRDSTTLYRWKDPQGQWQVSDTPPTDVPYEELNYRHDVNVIPSEMPTNKK